jgi:[acyl-carrier-protein] S-malonyltransferase
MAAVLGLAAGVVADVCRECSTGDEVAVPANLNGPDQVVISGDPGAVERAGERLKARGAKRVLPLKVSGAFHSPLMEPAAREFRAELDRLGLADPAFPIVANAAAVAVSDAAEARRLLGEQLTAPVRWVECVQVASQLAGESTYVEVGPGTVLTGLLKRIVPEAGSLALGTAEQVTQFLESHGG